VAQPGRAPGSGPGGRRFKSSLPDQSFQRLTVNFWSAAYSGVGDFEAARTSEINKFKKIVEILKLVRATLRFSHGHIGQVNRGLQGQLWRAMSSRGPRALIESCLNAKSFRYHFEEFLRLDC
jgi:hypothetical protein